MEIFCFQPIFGAGYKIIAPLRTEAANIEESDPASDGYQNIFVVGAVNYKCWMDGWRRIIFLFGFHLESMMAIAFGVAITGSGKAAESGYVHHLLIEFLRVDRMSSQAGEFVLQPF